MTVTKISRSDLAGFDGPVKITNLERLTSYDWLDKKTIPTIKVPGTPPLWSPPLPAPKLKPDSGLIYIDQNGARSPQFPMEPLFRALYTEHPDFDIDNVDLVTDRNNIRKLLRFVQGSASDPFQIRVNVVGEKTVLFTRVETKTTEFINSFRGFGHTFEEAYTKKERGSQSHHVVVRYEFGGLKCIIRHETDACVGSREPKAAKPPTDNLADVLEGLSLSVPGTSTNTTHGSPAKPSEATVVVEKGGQASSLDALLEIKTRAISRRLELDEVCPQLWISQTSKLVVAYHQRGMFPNVPLQDMTSKVRQWEETHQKDLRNLASLLNKIVSIVKGSSEKAAVVKYELGAASLQIVFGGKEAPSALPTDLYDKCQQTQKSAAGHGTSQGVPAKEDNFTLPVDTPYANHIKYAVHKGYRQFFRRMPTEIQAYRLLCQTLKSLQLDVLQGRNLKSIMADLRKGKDDYDPDERRDIDGIKTLARDSAFRLVYLILDKGSTAWEASDRNTAYNATFFVVSHPRIFKYRTRHVVRIAFEDKLSLTDKQRSMMDKWSSSRDEEEDDGTTEEEDEDGWYSGSDWS